MDIRIDKIAKCRKFQVTWRDILTGAGWPVLPLADDEQGPEVYVFYDSVNVPIYVGGSSKVFDRLLTHVGKGTFSWASGPTPVGEYIISAGPEAHDWVIELLCLPKHVEPGVIAMYNPWFNADHCDGAKSTRPTPAPGAKQDLSSAPCAALGLRL